MVAQRTQGLEAEGRTALTDHAIDSARATRERYGVVDFDAIREMLADRRVLRYPTELCFDAGPLQAGEFAYAQPLGAHPRDGFRLCVHPHFADRRDDLPALIAYHLVAINYGDVATHQQAEVYGATLLGLETDEYYSRICRLADELVARRREPCIGG